MKLTHPYRYAHFTNGIPYHKYFLYQSGGLKFEFKFDFREDYNNVTNTIDVFIGDRKECILITIAEDNKKVAHIQNFHYPKKLPRISGTRILMKTALEYISLEKGIKKVTLTDKAVFTHKSDKIQLFILYLFKYGESYYQKNFGFKYMKKIDQITQAENMKIREKHFINKKKVKKELLQYFSKEKIDRFLEFIKNGELIADFVKNFTCPENLFDIYFAFLKYEFKDKKYNNLFGEVLCKFVKQI
jgi:hypothetical protein